MSSSTQPAQPARHVLLRGADPGMAAAPCYSCGEPSFPGRVFVGVDLQTHGTAGFLCPACSRAAAPTLTAVAGALNLLRALAPDLDPGQHSALTGALTEIAESLPVPTPATDDERNPA